MNVPVYVFTCDKYLPYMRSFAYLFNVYWSTLQEVKVIGYKEPDFILPTNFTFYSAGEDGGQKTWSDGVIKFLSEQPDELAVILLDDYWLCRKADNTGVDTLADYVHEHPSVLRMDLTTDRLYNGAMFEVGAYGHYDIIETPAGAEYQMSTQAGIWRLKLLRDLLKPGMSPWDVELETSPPESMRVLGTRQNPVKYANAFVGGNLGPLQNMDKIPSEHVEYMRNQGWLE